MGGKCCIFVTDGGMKSWGLKEINFRTAIMIINSTNLRETTHAPIFIPCVMVSCFVNQIVKHLKIDL